MELLSSTMVHTSWAALSAAVNNNANKEGKGADIGIICNLQLLYDKIWISTNI